MNQKNILKQAVVLLLYPLDDFFIKCCTCKYETHTESVNQTPAPTHRDMVWDNVLGRGWITRWYHCSHGENRRDRLAC